jgi:hypothetical protein
MYAHVAHKHNRKQACEQGNADDGQHNKREEGFDDAEHGAQAPCESHAVV